MKFLSALGMVTFLVIVSQHLLAQSIWIARCTDCPNNQVYETHTQMQLPGNSVAFHYDPPSVFPIGKVSEDFGSRINSKRCWHTGIDINNNHGGGNSDIGDAIYPLDTGTVLFIKGKYDYKAMCLKTLGGEVYGLGHLFYNGPADGENGKRCGNFLLKTLKDSVHDYSIIYYDGAGSPVIAYGRRNGDTVVVKNANGQDTSMLTTNRVSPRIPVAPLGMSGASGGAHLHFYRFKREPANYKEFIDNIRSDHRGYKRTWFGQVLNGAPLLSNQRPDFHIDLLESRFDIKAAGSQRSSMAARVTIPTQERVSSKRYRTLADAEEVRFLIRPDHPDSSFREIIGNRTYSHLSAGGLKDTFRLNPLRIRSSEVQRYPAVGNPYPIEDSLLDIGFPKQYYTEGSPSRTGVRTNQYNEVSGRPSGADDYFYTDFYHRIRRGHNPHAQTRNDPVPLARSPAEAQYPDGPYTIKAELETLREEVAATTPDEQAFLIDNYRPMVTSVVVYNRDILATQVTDRWWGRPRFAGGLGYAGSWSWSSTGTGQYSFEPPFASEHGLLNPIELNLGSGDQVLIKVSTSEPMAQLEIVRIEPLEDLYGQPFPPSEIPVTLVRLQSRSENSRNWIFSLDAGVLGSLYNGYHRLHFQGSDLAGNPLLGLERAGGSSTIPAPVTSIPHRTGANTFSFHDPKVTDKVHGFLLNAFCGAKSGECLQASISRPDSIRYFRTGLKVNFRCAISGGTSPYTITWVFGDGATAGGQSAFHEFDSAGIYPVIARVRDANGLLRTTEPVYLNIYDPNNPVPVARFQPSTIRINQGGEVRFVDQSFGGTPPYTYSWSFDQASPASISGQGPHKVIFNQVGTQRIHLDITDAQGRMASYARNIEVKPATKALRLEVRTIPELDEAVFKILNVNTGAEAWLPGYIIDWDFGNGERDFGTFLTSNRHQYAKGGIYQAKATIRHLFGEERFQLSGEVRLWATPAVSIQVDPGQSLPPGQVLAGIPAQYTADMSQAPPPPGYFHEYEWEFEVKNGPNVVLPYDRNNRTVSYTFSQAGNIHGVRLHVRTRNAAGTLQACAGVFGVSKCSFGARTDVEVLACKHGYPLPRQAWLTSPGIFQVHGGSILFDPARSQPETITISPNSRCGWKRISVPVGFFWEESGIDFRSYSNPFSFQRNDPLFNHRLRYEYDMSLLKLHYSGLSLSTAPTPILKPLRTERRDFSEDYLYLAWFEFDWDEFQRTGSEEYLYYAIITIRERGCQESMTLVKQICLSSQTGIDWSVTCEGDPSKTWPFGQQPGGTGNPVTRLPDTVRVTDYLLRRYQKSGLDRVLGEELETKGVVLIADSGAFHFKAGQEIRLRDEFEVLPGGRFTAYIESAGPIFQGCSNYTGYVRQGSSVRELPGDLITIAPNPMPRGTPLRMQTLFAHSQAISVEVWTQTGQRILTHSLHAEAGHQKHHIPLPSLSAGLYIARISYSKEMESLPFLIEP